MEYYAALAAGTMRDPSVSVPMENGQKPAETATDAHPQRGKRMCCRFWNMSGDVRRVAFSDKHQRCEEA
jgi:hypothetical protein